MADGTNPFILLARITVKPGQLDAYLDLAATADAAVEASEPGMLLYGVNQDGTDPHKLVWTEVYRRSDDFLFHADNPAVASFLERQADLLLDIEVEIYGTVSPSVIDRIDGLGVPLRCFPSTRVGFVRSERFA
jgi:quinol monooxygenase YgiN